MIEFFRTILYQPLFNILIFLYSYIPGNDLGIAVIILTVLIKLLFFPLGLKAIKSQKALSDLQPKIKEIQKKYKDKAEQSQKMMELYKKEKINPFSGCLPLLIQLPVLIALFWVFRTFEGGISGEEFQLLYSFISRPETVNPYFLGMLNLLEPSMYIAVLAGIFQFLQTRMTVPKVQTEKKSDFSSMMQKQMQYIFPIITVVILLRLPSAIGLYWMTTTIFTLIQQYVVFKKKNNGELQRN